jgi:SOS-response transcriptional repressor LexA
MAFAFSIAPLNHGSRIFATAVQTNGETFATVVATPNTYSERLLQAMQDAKIGTAELARAIKVSYQAIRKVQEGGKFGTENHLKVAQRLGVSSEWLANGKGPKKADAESQASNVAPAPSRRRVPLISWVQAGAWSDITDPFQPGDADEWAEAFDSLPGNNAFALHVVGDSMTNPIPGQRTFPEGTIIIVDPARGASAGDFVIAKDVQTQQATFKQLTTDGGRWFLRPLNPAYPTVEIDDPGVRVIGRVVEFQTRGKL